MEWFYLTAAGLLGLVLLALLALNIYLILELRRGQSKSAEATPLLQGLTQAVQNSQVQTAALAERVSQVQPVTQTVGSLQAEVRGLVERISTVESSQGQVQQGVGYLANQSVASFSELKTITNALAEATAAMRAELSRARSDLTELHSQASTAQHSDRQIAESVRRLEMVIAGVHSKGAAGENILEVVFSRLPVEWQVRDFKIAGKPVEFGLRLPNRLILPIDSKWTATHLLEQFTQTDDLAEQQRLKKAIEDAVLLKAKEVRKYIDPSLTVNFGVAVVPDAVYELCGSVQADVFQLNVVLVSYSLFVPYLLLVFQTMLKSEQSIDLQRLDTSLQIAQQHLSALQEELDGRFSRGLTMLGNSRDEMRQHLGKVSTGLAGVQLGSGTASDDALPPTTEDP